jgi:16S rRNA (uracil1498-N3)-methyltransferase
MNLILFSKEEIIKPLSASDPRYIHIKNILKIGKNETFDSGIINGPSGIAVIRSVDKNELFFQFFAKSESSPLYPVTLIIGTPRPPTARRLLKDMTSAGIDRIWFTGTELGEKSYLTSKIWKEKKYMEYVIEGAQQGESTLLPEIRRFHSLKQCLEALEPGIKCALDNNESSQSISTFQGNIKRTVLAIGSERGWTEKERNLLKGNDFTLLSMGSRVLRTETACSMGIGLILSSMNHL